ncbi:flagellar assembly peptidoglycan hydrolase FlgJ [Pseudothauera lacus]|uniref:Peptidoglycan hydrolase FlgJ n=1 Tax=Pseudothauera lacus TaxID=2136175 RepID=A0A2T4IHW3_9RHOO|nr:flagellar assembly peptidoglycan hydrolase FlgJ [Pseudothauera lacus]PTD97351.1 flagellar assembly peptidoglycan hydrolase FlgJ [Pseudothauera lacus]
MSNGFQLNALDPNSLGDLKRLARENPNSPEALRAASRQFEALFMQMVLKSMREASLGTGMFDSEQSKTYQSLLDQQLALNMAHSGNNGLGEALFRQLGGLNAARQGADAALSASGPGTERGFDLSGVIRQSGNAAALARQAAARSSSEDDPVGALIGQLEAAAQVRNADGSRASGAGAFVAELWPHAEAASRRTGIPAHFMVAQAALETGWGEKVLRHADGRSSHNLFNIKAGAGWQGETVSRRVTEYANGRPYTEEARFRSYASYAEAFDDYARLLANSPRYSAVLGQTTAGGFARSLQQAGYATDPLYADKLTRVIGGPTLRNALGA